MSVASRRARAEPRECRRRLYLVSVHLSTRLYLICRFHYLISRQGNRREALRYKPLSSISARGKLVFWRGRVLALLQLEYDLVVLDMASHVEIGRVPRAGGKGVQEVLYDVNRSVRAMLTDSGTARTHCPFFSASMERRGSSICS